MLCHGELVRLRPEPRYLTGFYLMISAGGALGGLSVSLIAPQVFNSYAEWKIGLVAGFVLAATVAFVLAGSRSAGDSRRRAGLPKLLRAAGIVVALLALVEIVSLYCEMTNYSRYTITRTNAKFLRGLIRCR